MILVVAMFLLTSNEVPAPCELELSPERSITPRIQPRLHNEYEGHADVRITVDQLGFVIAAKIIAQEWKAVGHAGKTPIGYEEGIISAVRQWKYPVRAKACSRIVTVKFDYEN